MTKKIIELDDYFQFGAEGNTWRLRFEDSSDMRLECRPGDQRSDGYYVVASFRDNAVYLPNYVSPRTGVHLHNGRLKVIPS